MDLSKLKAAASELEVELRRMAIAVKVSPALRTVDEQSDKLKELADVAGSIADQLSETQIEGFDAIRDAMDCEVTNG